MPIRFRLPISHLLLGVSVLLLAGKVTAQPMPASSASSDSHLFPIDRTVLLQLGDDAETDALEAEMEAPLPAGIDLQLKAKVDANRRRRLQDRYSNSPQSSSPLVAPRTPVLGKNYVANASQGTPNDNSVAVSNSGFVVSVANSNVRGYDTTGKSILNKTLRAFSDTSNKESFDPRVIYDPISDRFIVAFLNGFTHNTSNLVLAFSTSGDPRDPWHVYKLPGNPLQNELWSDYPMLSLNHDEVFVTLNLLIDSSDWRVGFRGSIIWQVDKTSGYAGDSLKTALHHDIVFGGKPVWSVCPVQSGATPHGPNAYFLSVRPGDESNDTLFVHEVSNTIASGAAQVTTRVTTMNLKYGLPPNAFQPNGQLLATNDARVLSAIYENGVIQFAGNTIDRRYISPGIYLGQITGLDQQSPTAVAQIIGYDTLDIGYPSIGFVGDTTAKTFETIVAFVHSSLRTFPGTSAVFVDKNFEVSPPLRVKSGTTGYNVLKDSVERWGDYTGCQRVYTTASTCIVNGSYGFTSVGTSNHGTWVGFATVNDGQLSVGPSNRSESKFFTISPNPSQGETTIALARQDVKEPTLRVFDLTGRAIVSQHIVGASSTLTLPTGSYYVQVQDADGTIAMEKLVVTR